MKIAIWAVFGLLVSLWTAGALVIAQVTQWATQLVTSGIARDLGHAAAGWPMPGWLSLWVDPEWFRAFKSTMLLTLDGISDALPFVESTLGWLVPMVWGLWAVGALMMLGVAILAHWLAGHSTVRWRRGMSIG